MSGMATGKIMDSVSLPGHSLFHCDGCFLFENLNSGNYCYHLILVVAAPDDKQGMSYAGLAMGQCNLSGTCDYMASALLDFPTQIFLCRLDSENQNEDASG